MKERTPSANVGASCTTPKVATGTPACRRARNAGTAGPDRPPVPGRHASQRRDYEYKRLGTVSLLAGLDLHTGRVTEIVRDTHNSGDFIALLGKLDQAYPEKLRIRLIVDNHSSHISKQTQGYLKSRGRGVLISCFCPPMARG